MSTVGAISSYSSYSTSNAGNTYAASAGKSAGTSAARANTTTSGATNVTLSNEAKAALETKSFLEVIEEARASLSKLVEDADAEGPYKNGKLVIDMSGFDRRELWAIASNTDDTFTEDEIKAAGNELQSRFDSAMAGPMAVYKVTGVITKIYQAAQDWFAEASSEEKTSDAWKTGATAVEEALSALQTDPSRWPDIKNDPVTDYISRAASGEVGDTQDFGSVADNARAALDVQMAAAAAQGKSLNFSKYQKSGIKVDFSDFSSRALSAIALNQGEQFSVEEVAAAKEAISGRGRKVLMSCITDANKTSSPTALAENIISAYASLSSEELQAVGWNDTLYEAALANYKSASTIASMFNNSGSAGGLAGLLGGGGSSWSSGLSGLF